MERDIVVPAAFRQLHAEHALHRVRRNEIGHAVAQIMDQRGGNEFSERLADHRLRLRAQQLCDIGRDARNHPVGAQRYQKAHGLDGPEQMDGFAIAVGQIDRHTSIRHAAS